MSCPSCIICIPFSSDDNYRRKAFQEVYWYYSKLGYNIYIGESDPFTRAAARNGAVPNSDFDVIVFLDSDIIVPLDQIQKAIEIAYNENELVLAYSDLYYLNQEQTDFYYNNKKFDKSWKKIIKNQISGAFAIPKNLWKKVGGYDERFTEWGGEDRAFYYSCAAVQNKTENKRIEGFAYHLYHPKSEFDSLEFIQDNWLLKKYKKVLELSNNFHTSKIAFKDNASLLSILKERNGPLNFETEGYLSCPIDILSALPYSQCNVTDPLIGITISCFKSQKTIKRALLSALSQTFKNYVIFVVSDGDLSSFNSIKDDVDVKDDRILFLRSKVNRGRYAIDHLLCSHVLPMFGCTYWAPLDSDDIVDINWLKELLKKSKEKDYDLVLSDQIVVGKKTIIESAKYWNGTDKFVWHGHLSGLWKLSFVLENNLTNPKYRIGWDSIMTSVPFLIGKVDICKKPLYTRIKTPGSLTQSKTTGQGSILRKQIQSHLRNVWKNLVDNKDDVYMVKELLRRERCTQ